MSDGREDPDSAAPSARRRRSEGRGTRRRRSVEAGRRRTRRRQQRRRAARRVGVAVLGLVVVAGVAVGVATLLRGDGTPTDPGVATTPPPAAIGDDPQPTLVVATFDETEATGANLVMLLAATPGTDEGTIVLVPPNVVADVPGEGLFQLGETFRQGEAPLLELTLSNLLGLDLDASAGISRQGWAALLDRIDGLTLDVEEDLVQIDDGTRSTRFRAGVQPLDGARVAEYLTFRQPGENELQRLSRVQQVLVTLLDRIVEDPDVLDTLFADGAPMIEGADPEAVRFLLQSLARARAADQLEVRTLPVRAIGSGDDASYRIQQDRVDELVEEELAASVPSGAGESGRRLQVLNGNGTPGIGSAVADALQPAGFRLVETGNAASFDVPRTRIVVYEDSPEQLAVAREAQQLLGVGEIEVSEVPVSVVDVTVIVGADFPPDG